MLYVRYNGAVADYGMRREEIRDKGYILAVPDEYLKSCKVGNVLFRVWFQVGRQFIYLYLFATLDAFMQVKDKESKS